MKFAVGLCKWQPLSDHETVRCIQATICSAHMVAADMKAFRLWLNVKPVRSFVHIWHICGPPTLRIMSSAEERVKGTMSERQVAPQELRLP